MSKILVVEDHRESRYMMEQLLVSRGHLVVCAADGLEALDLARREHPQVIISDIMMPGMNGFRLCREIKKDPQLNDIPFIFYTATFVEKADEELAMSLGASRFIIKPAEGDRFIHMLDEVLEQYRRGQLMVPASSLEDEETLLQMYDSSVTRKLAETVEKLQKEQRALAESERRLKEAEEIASMGHWALDLQSGEMQWSDEMYRIFGLAPHQIDASRTAFLERIHPRDREMVERTYRNSLEKRTRYDIDYRLVLGEDRIKWVHERCQTIYDDEGRPICSMGTVQDISERKRVEEALVRSEQKYRSLFDEALDMIHIVDPAGIIQDVNPVELATLGYLREEYVGRPLLDIIHPDCRDRVSAIIQELLGGQGTASYETVYLSASGEQVLVEVNTVAQVEDGQVTSLRSIGRNVTRRRQQEQRHRELEAQLAQARKLEAIGTLAGGIAHDFNNILTAILGYGEMVFRALPEESEAWRQQRMVLQAGRRAQKLVKQILVFSRQGVQELHPVPLHRVVKEVIRLLRASIPATIEIRENIQESGMVLADATHLHQVVMNLCTNGVQAMGEKGGVLSVALSPVEMEAEEARALSLAPGHFICLEVGDTGHGMDREIREKIFDPYFTTRKHGEGTGLGLSIVHGIVQSLGGHLAVYSEKGIGTTFHVYLPRVTIAMESGTVRDTMPLPGGRECLMVVDDQQEIALMMQRMLAGLGYDAVACTSPTEALAAFTRHPDRYDLLITDTTMPGMSGIDLAGEILRLKADVPVLLVTGFGEPHCREQAREIGVAGCIMKPVVLRDLALTVRELLDRRTAADEGAGR
ncbi:hybrid sensor histidine kinase/response regulator [Desulfolithobacter sp.]